MTHFDLKTMLPALLHVEDRVSMAVSLESRVPLLDYRIVELAAKMPPAMKFSGGKTKAMLVKAARNHLPKAVVERKDKMGFPTPLNEWMAGDLKTFVLDILLSQRSKERNLLDTSAIETQVMKSGKFSRDIWGALNLEMWFREFID
jgi:asparagine synthase (glutamine-hydrolysing)